MTPRNPLRDVEHELIRNFPKERTRGPQGPQLNLPSDGFKGGDKNATDHINMGDFMPIAKDLQVFRKWLQANELDCHFTQEPADKDSKAEMFVYLDDDYGLSKSERIGTYHIHVILRKGQQGKWRLTAALPKESNWRRAKELPLVGTPADWYENTGVYPSDATKELVRRFATAVLNFKKSMKEAKRDLGSTLDAESFINDGVEWVDAK